MKKEIRNYSRETKAQNKRETKKKNTYTSISGSEQVEI